jgi:hypothetical protein
MIEKQSKENQTPVTPCLQPARLHPSRGGLRAGAGRKKGVPNKITQTFRDLVIQAAAEVGDSREEGVDGTGGVLGYLKKAAVREEKTFLLMMARLLPLKVNAELKQARAIMTIEEAVTDLKSCGLDELLAVYLKRYPIERDEEEDEWGHLILM